MYEELVERLRTCGNSLSCNKCKWSSNCGGTGEVLRKAADAIEGLSGLIDHYGGETGLKNLQEYASKYWDLLKNAPRWVSVTKKPPEKDVPVFVYLFSDSPYIAWINHEGEWETEEFTIDRDYLPKAWMPLPTPPKEE